MRSFAIRLRCAALVGVLSLAAADARADENIADSPLYKRLKIGLDSVAAIDTHDHLWPFERLPGYVQTDHGRGMNLAGLWQSSYFSNVHSLTPWQAGQKFDDWWQAAKHDFDNARATSFYRYQAVAIQDLYGIDFDRITAAEARELDQRIFENYRDDRWLREVIGKRANIELMFNDPHWAPYDFRQDYPFTVLVVRVNPLFRGFHASEFKTTAEDPYYFARRKGLRLESLDDYLLVLDALLQEARQHGAVCMKSSLAYQRTLDFENVSKDRAAAAFGKPRSELTPRQVKDFEDFIMWQLVERSARFELPLQIHTGLARIQGSNPMLLVDLIQANPKTRFILFHGGYPWIGESGAIAMKYRNVWLDSCWLPVLSYTAAKRAYCEWLEVIPSNKILWGADCNHAEGIYGATELTRRALAEVLAEKVERHELLEAHAARIGRQILRDNALELFPQLKARLRPDAETR